MSVGQWRVEKALAPLAIGCLQLGQVLDVDVNETEVVILVGALSPRRFGGGGWLTAVETFRPENVPDAIAVEMGQEMGDD